MDHNSHGDSYKYFGPPSRTTRTQTGDPQARKPFPAGERHDDGAGDRKVDDREAFQPQSCGHQNRPKYWPAKYRGPFKEPLKGGMGGFRIDVVYNSLNTYQYHV